MLKPILPQLRADKASAEARFERDVAAPARTYAERLREGAEAREWALLRELGAARRRRRVHDQMTAALVALERQNRNTKNVLTKT